MIISLQEALQSFKTAAGIFECMQTWQSLEYECKDVSGLLFLLCFVSTSLISLDELHYAPVS